MTTHHNNGTSTTLNRKSCNICNKLVYLHQPILYCPECSTITHGICLGLNNDKVYVLQQTSWKCVDCCAKLNHVVLCCNCNLQIHYDKHKFNLHVKRVIVFFTVTAFLKVNVLSAYLHILRITAIVAWPRIHI